MSTHSPEAPITTGPLKPAHIREINASVGEALNRNDYLDARRLERHTTSSQTAEQIIRITGRLMEGVLEVPGVIATSEKDLNERKDRNELVAEDSTSFRAIWLPSKADDSVGEGALLFQKKTDLPVNKNLHGVREPHHGTTKHKHTDGEHEHLHAMHVSMSDRLFKPKRQTNAYGKVKKDKLGRKQVVSMTPQRTVETGARKVTRAGGNVEYEKFSTVRMASNQYAKERSAPAPRNSSVAITRKEAARQLWNARNEVYKVRAAERARVEAIRQAEAAKKARRKARADRILPNRVISNMLRNRRARHRP